MKKIFVIFLVLINILIITSCNDESNDQKICKLAGEYCLHHIIVTNKVTEESVTYEIGSKYYGMILTEGFLSIDISPNYHFEGSTFYNEETPISFKGNVDKNYTDTLFKVHLDEPCNFGFNNIEPYNEMIITHKGDYYYFVLNANHITFSYYVVKYLNSAH